VRGRGGTIGFWLGLLAVTLLTTWGVLYGDYVALSLAVSAILLGACLWLTIARRSRPETPSGALLDLQGIVFAGFLSAGYLKADPRLEWLPVDLTLLLALGTGVVTVVHFARQHFRIPKSLGPILGLFLVLSLPLFWTQWTTYSTEKATRLFTLTLLATITPLFLFRSKQAVRRFLNALAIVGILMAGDAIANYLTAGGAVARLSAFGSDPIALGRASGAAVLWLAVLAFEKQLNFVLATVVLSPLLLATATSARGPFLFTVGTIGLAFWAFYAKDLSRATRFALTAALLGLALLGSVRYAPEFAVQRLRLLATGQLGPSETMRLDAYRLSWQEIQRDPLGKGWGGFASEINLWPSLERQYPHNILAETFLEAGWIPGVYLTALLALGITRARRLASDPEAKTAFLLLAFFLGNAMVSGDVNSNRSLFAFLSLALAFPFPAAAPSKKNPHGTEG